MSVIINYSIDSLSPIDNVNGIQLPFSSSSLDDGPGENFIGRLPSSVNLGLAGRAEARRRLVGEEDFLTNRPRRRRGSTQPQVRRP